PRHFSIPPGEAAETLLQFGRQSDRSVAYDFDRVQHQPTHAVEGEYEVGEALRLLLKGSGLGFRITAGGGVFGFVQADRAQQLHAGASVPIRYISALIRM